MLVAISAATLFCAITGPFGTFNMPFAPRLMFWSILFAINGLLWAGWFRLRLRPGRSWQRVAAEGAILFTLPMPLEIMVAAWISGFPAPPQFPTIWLHSLALAALLMALLLVLVGNNSDEACRKGHLWRSGFGEGAGLAMIRADDHYCRLIGTDGQEKLVYARFADLQAEVADMDGMIVRRGCWVAADAVQAIAREDRKWQIQLKSGDSIAIPASQVSKLREAGWL